MISSFSSVNLYGCCTLRLALLTLVATEDAVWDASILDKAAEDVANSVKQRQHVAQKPVV
jgi:hypothetical protein